MLGAPPDDFIKSGKNGSKYFCRITPGKKSSSFSSIDSNKSGSTGAVPIEIHSKFRLKTAEEYATETGSEVPVLRKYLRYSKLDDVILKCPLANKSKLSQVQKAEEMRSRRCFLDFLLGLFKLDPSERWTAKQAARHPFITNAPFPPDQITPVSVISQPPLMQPMDPTPSASIISQRDFLSPPRAVAVETGIGGYNYKQEVSVAAPLPEPANKNQTAPATVNPPMITPPRRRSMPLANYGSYPFNPADAMQQQQQQQQSRQGQFTHMLPPPTLPGNVHAYSYGYGNSYGGQVHAHLNTNAPHMNRQQFQQLNYPSQMQQYPPANSDPYAYSFGSYGGPGDMGSYGGSGGSMQYQPQYFTDFGQALIRPDMNEQRRLMSQQQEEALYWHNNNNAYASSHGSSFGSPRGGSLYGSYGNHAYNNSVAYSASGKTGGPPRSRQGSFSGGGPGAGRERNARFNNSSAAQDNVTELAFRLDGAFEGLKGYSNSRVTFAEPEKSSHRKQPQVVEDDEEGQQSSADWEPFFAADDLDMSTHGSSVGGSLHGTDRIDVVPREDSDDIIDLEGREELVGEDLEAHKLRLAEEEMRGGKSLPKTYLLMQHAKFMQNQRALEEDDDDDDDDEDDDDDDE
jgi:serine/threonine protein kinase